MGALRRDETIMAKVKRKELLVAGAFYEISSGIVDFFLEITEPKHAPKPTKRQQPSSRSTASVRIP